MDRAELSEAIVRELGERFVSELVQAGPGLVTSDLDGIEQQLQVVSRRVMGRLVEAAVTVPSARGIAAGPAGERPSCGSCQQRMRAVDPARSRAVQGLVGDYWVRRAYCVCDRCGHGVAPLDERLGLGPGALSPGLARVACRVGLEDGFGTAAEAEQQRMVELAPAALVVEVDGVHVHASGDWHEMKQAGMRWSHDGAQTVASLRALHRSDRWDHCWQTHPQRRRSPSHHGSRPPPP